tara:strand:- start:28 stop:282 length:255 start_codon:yes stop_codon:yes gene_type:complete
MAIRHISDLVTDNSNTYANTDEFFAEHGPCGSTNPGCTSINFEMQSNTGVRRTIIFEDETQFQAFFPNSTDKAFTVTKIEKVTI